MVDEQQANNSRRRYLPTEVEDETADGHIEPKDTPSLRVWISRNKLTAVALVLFGIFAIIIFWRFASLFSAILTNVWTYAILGIALTLFLVFMFGRISYKSGLAAKDKLDIDMGDSAISFVGELQDTPNGKEFYPILSRRFFGLSPRYMQVRDVSSKMTNVPGVTKGPRDRLPILVPSDVSKRVDETPYGTEIFAHGSSLEPQTGGGFIRLQLQRPNRVDEESYQKLRTEFQKLEGEYESLQQEKETMEVEKRRAEERARKKYEEIEKKEHGKLTDILDAIGTVRVNTEERSDRITIRGDDE